MGSVYEREGEGKRESEREGMLGRGAEVLVFWLGSGVNTWGTHCSVCGEERQAFWAIQVWESFSPLH